jgi:uncharacterized membrane protein
MPPSEAAVNQGASAASMPPRFARVAHWITFFLVFTCGLAARIWRIGTKPFWFDECFSVEVARIDWRNFLHLMWWREANMSLYYLLLRGWLHWGQSPAFIRSLSALISAACLLAIYWLATQLYDRRVGLIATALLSCNVFDIRYAQEARSYSLFLLLAMLSSGFLIAFCKNSSRRNWRAYVIFSALAVYAHFYALLLIVAQGLALYFGGRLSRGADDSNSGFPRQIRRAWITIGIAVLPLLVFVAKTGAGPIKWIHRPGIAELVSFSSSFTNGLPIVYLAASVLAVIPFQKDLVARGVESRKDWEKLRTQFLFVWLLFPILLTVLLSFARPVFLPRYMIFCLPALLILTAAGLANLRPAWLGAAFVCLILLFSARFVPFIYSHDFDDERDASGSAVDYILDYAAPGDGIILHIAEARVPYEFFRSLRAGENTASPLFTQPLGPEVLFPHHGPGLDYRDFTGKPAADLIRGAATDHERIWLMLMNNGPAGKPDPTTVMLTQVLPQNFPKLQTWEFARVELRLYSKQ